MNCYIGSWSVMSDPLEGNVTCVFGEVFGSTVSETVTDESVEKVGTDFAEPCTSNDI